MSKIQEFMANGDIHLVAKILVREFLDEMRRDFPPTDSSDATGHKYWHTTDVQLWLDKWLGVDK